MGLQYLVDRPELSRDRGRVFDEIADGTITIEKIESSDFYNKIGNLQRGHSLSLRLEVRMDLKDMILVTENDRGTETNMLMALDDYKSFIAVDDMSELQYITPIDYAKRIAELDEDLRDAAEILVTDCSCYTPFRAFLMDVVQSDFAFMPNKLDLMWRKSKPPLVKRMKPFLKKVALSASLRYRA